MHIANRVAIESRRERGVRALQHEVILLAAAIEGCVVSSRRWYLQQPINELGGLTAAQLVHQGRGRDVIRFLMDIISGLRG